MQRPVLLGMQNPLSVRPEHALFPHPVNCTGWRIWQMLKSRLPDVRRSDYLRTFDRRNILRGPWDPLAARRAAPGLQSLLFGRTVVLLGDAPRQALDIPRLLLHPQHIGGVTWRQIPHPSGRCRFYNDPVQRELVAMLLESLYLEWRGEIDVPELFAECV
jgi:hypothetical protein